MTAATSRLEASDNDRCNLLQLNDNKCRWPIGTPGSPDFLFCGGKTGGKPPYCAYHHRLAYTAPPGKRVSRPASVYQP